MEPHVSMAFCLSADSAQPVIVINSVAAWKNAEEQQKPKVYTIEWQYDLKNAM